MRWLVVIGLATALAFGATTSSNAATTPNLKVTLVVRAASACDMDMPCDPPIGSYVITFSRVGSAPVRVKAFGAGTIWVHLRPGVYAAKVTSTRAGVTGRPVSVRVRPTGTSTLRLVASI
jgi:hypothetical protein